MSSSKVRKPFHRSLRNSAIWASAPWNVPQRLSCIFPADDKYYGTSDLINTYEQECVCTALPSLITMDFVAPSTPLYCPRPELRSPNTTSHTIHPIHTNRHGHQSFLLKRLSCAVCQYSDSPSSLHVLFFWHYFKKHPLKSIHGTPFSCLPSILSSLSSNSRKSSKLGKLK